LPYSDLPKLLLLTLNLPEPPRLISPQELPLTWRDESDYSANHQFLIDWLTRPDVFAVGISSAVVAESVNYLLHPQHPSFERVKVTRSSAFSIDPRLWVASTG
jgi:RES domain-containing protein